MRGSAATASSPTSTTTTGTTAAAAAVGVGQAHGALLVLAALLPASPSGVGAAVGEQEEGEEVEVRAWAAPRALAGPSTMSGTAAFPRLCEQVVAGFLENKQGKGKGPGCLRRAAWALLPRLAALDPAAFW